MFTNIQNLALWKAEVEDRANKDKKLQCLKEETASKVEQSKERTENIFTEIINMALWRVEIEGKATIFKKNETLREETEIKVKKSQKKTEDMFNDIERLSDLKLGNIRREVKMEISKEMLEEIEV